MHLALLVIFLSTPFMVLANPHWNQKLAPKDSQSSQSQDQETVIPIEMTVMNQNSPHSLEILRITVSWEQSQEQEKAKEKYEIQELILENSGTQALINRATRPPNLGSYIGILKEVNTNRPLFYDSMGTGKEYRKLSRALSFRFPVPESPMIFELKAENPATGKMETVLESKIDPSSFVPASPVTLEVRKLQLRKREEKGKEVPLRVTLYSEGYFPTEKEEFFADAARTVKALNDLPFPGVEFMEFYAAFSPSAERLGSATQLGYPIPVKNTFLGLYFPYWNGFGRWYHVTYPTSESKFRSALAGTSYDFPIVLTNDSAYWGVGNYMTHTAIPAKSTNFSYLLFHELGHFFGLNEEYKGGGRTELEFAPGIEEPWSPNITLLRSTSHQDLKWKDLVSRETSLPTPTMNWYKPNGPHYGAYRGGYADSTFQHGSSHKPGFNCIMESGTKFCKICSEALKKVIKSNW